VGLHQAENHCTGKEQLTKWKGNLWIERKYLLTYIWFGVNLIQVSSKIIIICLKSGQRTWIDIFQRRCTEGRGTEKGAQHY
jgi:hypothetical protein